MLELMKRLAAVVDKGSVTGAADFLHVTQPAVTKSVQQLEEHFGTPLLHRSRKGTIPTASGEVVYKLAKQMEKSVLDVQAELIANGEAAQRRVAIGAGLLWCYRYLPEVVVGLSQKMPDLDISVIAKPPSELEDLLYRGELDIGVGQLPKDRNSGIVYEELLVSRGAIFCHFTHPAHAKARSNQAILNEYPWITFTEEDKDALANVIGEPRQAPTKINNLMLACLIMQSGQHMMWLPEQLDSVMERFGIERLSYGSSGSDFISGIFYPKAALLRTSTRAVIDEIRSLSDKLIAVP